MPEVDPFDHRNIRFQGIFSWIGRLIEIEVIIDRADLLAQELSEHLNQVVNERSMDGRFPHQILFCGVGIVVVRYLVFNVPGHRALLS